jgi:hypothetical protein
MSHKQVISACGTVPLGFLISMQKALRILLVHKILDTGFQLFLVKWACSFFAILGVGICGFSLLPMFLSVVVFALGISLFALLLWLEVGDIFLRFALEDRCFFELATGCHALDIFEDTEPSSFQPDNLVCGSGERRRFGILRHSFQNARQSSRSFVRDSTNVRRTKLIPAAKIVAHENSARETHVFVNGKYQEDRR